MYTPQWTFMMAFLWSFMRSFPRQMLIESPLGDFASVLPLGPRRAFPHWFIPLGGGTFQPVSPAGPLMGAGPCVRYLVFGVLCFEELSRRLDSRSFIGLC